MFDILLIGETLFIAIAVLVLGIVYERRREKNLEYQYLKELKNLLQKYKNLDEIEDTILNWKSEGYNVDEIEQMINELKRTDTGNELRTTAPNAKDFQKKLEDILLDAQQQGKIYIDVRSGDLHKEVGGYPGTNHRMPICCNVMRKEMKYTDQIIEEPPKGLGANLIIRYKLPR